MISNTVRLRLCALGWFCLLIVRAPAVWADDVNSSAPVAEPREPVVVELSLLNSTSLELSYTLPAACTELPLKTPYRGEQREMMRGLWKPSNGCGIERGGKIVRSNAQCSRVTFDVPIKETTADRVYPAAFPIGDLGVYVHTGIYAPIDGCGEVQWQFTSRKGDVVYQGAPRGGQVHVPQNDLDAAYMGVYLSTGPLAPDAKAASSPLLPAWIRTALEEDTGKIEEDYRRRFPQLSYAPPFIVASAVAADGPFRRQAEVAAGNMIRYAFFDSPDEPRPEDVASVRGIIAHEYGHKLQPAAIRKASAESDNFDHEGGAEFLRWGSMIRLGWLTTADAAAELNKALNTCLILIGDRPLAQVADRAFGDAPYACGLALHVLLLASRGERTRNADAVLESYYLRRDDHADDFGRALECGALKHCRARWAAALMSNSTPFALEIDKLIRALGIARRRYIEPARFLQVKAAAAALMQLMSGDCDEPSYGFSTHDDQGFEVGMSPNCKTFHDGMMLKAINGISLVAQPLRAARSLVARCATDHSATIEIRDGGSLNVSCRKLVPIAPFFYDLDIGEVLSRLGYAPHRSHPI